MNTAEEVGLKFLLPYSKNWKREFGRIFLQRAEEAAISNPQFDPKRVVLTDKEGKDCVFSDDLTKGQFPLNVRYILEPESGKRQEEDRREARPCNREKLEPLAAVDDISKEIVSMLLTETIRSREYMKKDLKRLTKEMIARWDRLWDAGEAALEDGRSAFSALTQVAVSGASNSTSEGRRRAFLANVQDKKQACQSEIKDKKTAELKSQLKQHIATEKQEKQLLEQMSEETTGKLFLEMYEKVQSIIPADPLAQHKISSAMFESLLEKYSDESFVQENLPKVLGTMGPRSVPQANVDWIAVEKIIEMHKKMLAVMKDLLAFFGKLENKTGFDGKVSITTAQAIVSARVEQLHHVTCEDLEGAMLLHQQALVDVPDFLDINVEVQNTMRKFLDKVQLGGPR